MKLNEESVFTEALAKSDPRERAAFLDQACAGDPGLRDSVDSLLAAHEAGSFLETPAVRPGDQLKGQTPGNSTQAEPSTDMNEGCSLDFLAPSDKPGVLGRLAHYDILEIIGKGGMGIVLRGFDEQLHRVVAIKVMAAQLATNATARKRFAREAQAQAAVSHDHIVTIHAVEAESSLPYLVMQYIAGMSLQERLDKTGALQLHEILRIGMQTAAGLAAAHSQGLVHRDIKPANILLENGVERVKVTDFGLARAATEASLTQSGVVAGTPQYMSPEQAEGKAIDQRTDLFSLGSVLYAMCTGRAPFRASGSMAVLKRVCEETPTPIRETNAEIPDWLVAIIDKLHAKDPDQRYQSATEVAELLGRHLAQVQHPSVVGQVSNLPQEPKTDRKPALRRSRWAAAAAVLLCFVAGLSLTEATGVTNVRATVIRIFTPDGTLVVEINDPTVKVTVEGDGGLVITGAGLEEIRLRPGNYKVQADKDGKKILLEREVVNIAKNGREVVRVKLEATPVPVVAKAENGAFVLLAAGKERKFNSLADAVQGASDGDTIEVRGTGPFVCDRINITQALTIRAAEGFRPVIKLTIAPKPLHQAGLYTVAPLVLEGLEFRVLDPDEMNGKVTLTVIVPLKTLRVANCRFSNTDFGCFVDFSTSPLSVLEFRNCEFLGSINSKAFAASFASGQKVILENCVSTMRCVIDGGVLTPKEPTFQLTRNTFCAYPCAVEFVDRTDRTRDLDDAKKGNNVLPVEASGNLFDSNHVLVFSQHPPGRILSPAGAQKYLAQVVGWKGDSNLYSVAGQFLTLYHSEKGLHDPAKPIKTLVDWKQFWTTAEDNSIEGPVRYQGGDLLAKVKLSPEKVTPEDFRLHRDSPGYRAGKDGKDLGADVDLVGPGPAYERWKKTPEYQQWLKDTKQLAKSLDSDHEAAEYVLSIGGTVCVNDENRVLKGAADLPPGPFRLTWMDLSFNKQVSDTGLAAFKDCKNLTVLGLQGTQVSDAGLAHFKDCKNLTVLQLMDNTQVSDAGLAHFKDCKNLEYLGLNGTRVSDAGLAYFKDCKNLMALWLTYTRVSDAGLAYFKDCKNLTHLQLSSTQTSDAGLAYFKDCKNLTQLGLVGTQVSDAGLAHFKDCKNLAALSLDGPKVSDAGLAHFKDCKNLNWLSLDGTQVSDAGLAHFKDCTNLNLLRLRSTQVSDAGLVHFKDCTNLTELRLQKTKVTAAKIAELKKALPKCKIEWDGGVIEPKEE